jgi:CBS domain-containing protein
MTDDLTIEREDPILGDKLRSVSVRDAMHPGIISCSQATTATEIARIMASQHVHCVAVISSSHDNRQEPMIWGIVSDLDLLEAAIQSSAPVTAATLARQPVISVRSSMSVHDAAKAMVEYGTNHVVVVDPDHRVPIGILSTIDVAELLAAGGP